jgi:hypothetical protein
MPWRLFYSFKSGPVFIAFALFLQSDLTIKSRADKTVLLSFSQLRGQPKVEQKRQDNCKIDFQDLSSIKARLPEIAESIVDSCRDQECYTHIDYEPIPSKEGVIDILNRLREILFPGYFSRGKVDPVNLKYAVGQRTDLPQHPA